MAIFTIVAAHPVDVQSHELPRVRVDSYIVSADSLPAAYREIAEYESIVGATEVFGIRSDSLLITPTCTHRREEKLEQWQHWSRMVRIGRVGAWQLLANGAETFQHRQDRLFAERHPHLAGSHA